jgi:heat shock protein HtpX
MFKNTMKTAALLAGIGALFMAVGSLLGGSTGLFIGLVLGLVFVGGSYWFSDKLAVKSARAVEVSPQEAPELHAIVEELAQRGGIPKPRVYMTPSEQPNAFATGRNEKRAVVAVTQGLMQTMDHDEIRGVLAHEISHVRHRDILISSVAAAVAMAITFIARMAMWSAIFGGGDDDDGGGLAGILMLVLAPVAAVLIQMAISRTREFEADRGAAELIGTGEPLARALEKLEGYSQRVPMDVNPAMEQAFIVNPLRGSRGRNAGFASMFSTHPPTEERIRRLREINSPISG